MNKKILLVDPISIYSNEADEIWNFENIASIKYSQAQSKAISDFFSEDITDMRHRDVKYISNYGLLMIGYLLKQNNIAVSYTNGDYFASEDDYIADIKANYSDYDVYCFTATTPQSVHVKRLAEAVKKMNKDAIIILGGPYTKYYFYHEKDDVYDYVVTGYGTDQSIEFIKKILNGEEIPHWRIDTKKYYDCPKDFSLVPEDKRMDTLWYNYFGIGCPHRCKYCMEPHEYICYADVKSRMDEIEYAIKEYDLKMFHFADSDFFLNEAICTEVIDEIERRGIKCTFTVNTSPITLIRIVNKSILERFRKNGLIEILLGTEHFSENVRKNISKYYDLNALQKALDIVKHKVGIPIVSLYSIVGLPFEGEEDIKINIETFKQMRDRDLFDFVFPKFFVPYPGSDIYMNPDKYGIQLVSDDFEIYNRKTLSRPVKINGMDDRIYVEEIMDIIRMNKEFNESEIRNKIENNDFQFNL